MGVYSRDKLCIMQKKEIYVSNLSIIILGERSILFINRDVSLTNS